MAKKEFLDNLFNAHTKDLNDVYPGQGDVIVCPICLRISPRIEIEEKVLTDGHVWPKYFRKISKKAKNMHVLLCSECNHKAGSRGDKHMQLEEQIRAGEAIGRWYGSRRVQLFKMPGEKPIDLNVKISGEMSNLTISGRIDKNKQWVDNSPEDQARFQEIVERGKEVSILIHPYTDVDSEKVPVGWITSAYLMAFYALGYRYILHPSLNPVREYITSSINPDITEQPVLPQQENFILKTSCIIDVC